MRIKWFLKGILQMSFRFRKSITLAPGLRLNLGTRGASLSAGPRGASVTIGRNGIFGNVGLPGTGLSYRTRLDVGRGTVSEANETELLPSVPTTAVVTEAGELRLTDPDGKALTNDARNAALRRNRTALQDLLERRAIELNGWFDRLLRPHLKTPAPSMASIAFNIDPFPLPKPEKPERDEPGLFGAWFGGRASAESKFQGELAHYRSAISEWRAAEENYQIAQEAALRRHEIWQSGDVQAAQMRFEERLGMISWPRETLIGYQASEVDLQIDIDLPEIEDMPAETARVLRGEMRVEMTEKGEAERRRDYASHVHSIAFRVTGEAFAAMGGLQSVLISGFSQRVSRAIGQVEAEYLYSVRIDRAGWERIDFSQLDLIDPTETLARFDLRRDMTKTGIFRPVIPIT